MDSNEFQRRLRALRASDLIEGPLALHWLFSAIARVVGPGRERIYFPEQADVVMEEAIAMRKLKKGHGQHSMTPWEVVHWRPPPQMARYHSCPCLPTTVQPVS